MTRGEFLRLVSAGESETIEFKESFNDESLETIGAFYNTRGGTLLIGIKDSGEICGIKIGKKTIEDISNRIQEATDPRLQPSISVFHQEDKDVVLIHISSGTGVSVSVRGRYFRRVGKTNQRMSHEEIMQRMVTSTGLSWDAFLEPGSKLDDLDPNLISRFIQTTKRLGRRPLPEQASDEEFLRKLDLLRDGTPTRAALLLFGKNPGSFFSSAFLKLGRFRSLTNIVDDREIHGSLFEQLEGAMNWFKERLETEFVIKGELEREEHWEYPLSALREAVVNALCHRDYTGHAHTQIRLFDQYLEIRNAGSLPPSANA